MAGLVVYVNISGVISIGVTMHVFCIARYLKCGTCS